MAGPTTEFWQTRFARQQTPWDRGTASPRLLQWLSDGSLSPGRVGSRIAVPGCGAGHELLPLAEAGFQVLGLDYAAAAIALSQAAVQASGRSEQVDLLQVDVLEWQAEPVLDAVYEQTCLCALHPDHWQTYATRLAQWLRPGGSLFALFMQGRRDSAALGQIEGPPYHCDIHAMRALFPAPRWDWPKPPYDRVVHPMGMEELAVVLVRR